MGPLRQTKRRPFALRGARYGEPREGPPEPGIRAQTWRAAPHAASVSETGDETGLAGPRGRPP
eukprot:2522999-Lingulodinium_polyedra.AAC.1